MNDYIEKVLSGELVAPEKIKNACQRHLNDLERSQSEDFPYLFDEKKADKAIKFMQLLPGTDGQPIQMLGFQKFIIGSLYGWRTKQGDLRRFNRALISMSRKNSKTYICSGIAANALIMEKEPAEGRQVLFTANSTKQARIGYDMLANSLQAVSRQSKFMRQQLKIMQSKIVHKPSNSFAMALASETNTLDGFGATVAIRDEAHEAKTRKVENVLKSGMMNQKNGLLATITTAGLDMNVPLYEDYMLAERILQGLDESDRYFIAIWELDNEKEMHDQEKWIKANPIFESEKMKETMIPAIQDDADLALKQDNLNAVLVKNFNLWRQASEDSYLPAKDWNAVEVQPQPIRGCPVYIGIDLSKTDDLTSVSWIVPVNGKLYCDSHSFVATKYGLESKEKKDGLPYRKLEKEGECSITQLESGIVDYEQVFKFIQNLIEENELDLQGICYDPFNANSIISMAEKENYPMIEVRQGTRTLNVPTRTFREQVFASNIIHPKNTILTHAVNNALTKEDNNGIQINKAKNSNKIDPMAALINAYVFGMNHYEEAERSVADNEFYKSEAFSF
ncbi:terminase large subunit [Tetragenococcus koreensis]|uniref:Phage terminase large subunit n=1 Tax=Tetragenococcus koreensis TaxID=290335 RepID=A0AAN4ZRM5_9ENTE|nr:terminase TerL endonuclease subunit [Tetragenococcus koreensis]MDN6641124.1 terminase large subunit [Tetragenococcus sp.]MCF1584571.1 terminase large subunit [Tetragenococcus koreensis]MCF1628894.1 terminase large subunit [Tetragenococcus koreensis]MCF1641922.1 terminase large subunit [Tetragenococcus koreensis]GEQ49811.1 phage terminase large subunit [Tetragenococcus koreensis]